MPTSVLRKIPAPVFILPTIALLLSAFMTWANATVGTAFLALWARNFATSLVALPLILLGIGQLEKLVAAVAPGMGAFWRKVVVSLLSSLAIESLLALVISLINNPWDASLSAYWWQAFSRSLPVGLLIGFFMGFYMKPKLDAMRRARQA
nr:hypothetical protein [uncultured Rhodoferax sp.]